MSAQSSCPVLLPSPPMAFCVNECSYYTWQFFPPFYQLDHLMSTTMMMGLFTKKNNILYSSLGGESEKDDDTESSSGLLGSSEASKNRHQDRGRVWPYVLPWVLSTVVLALTSIYLFLDSLPPAPLREEYSFSAGWKTDFGPYIVTIVVSLANKNRLSTVRNKYRGSTLHGESYLFREWYLLRPSPSIFQLHGWPKPRTRQGLGRTVLGYTSPEAIHD